MSAESVFHAATRWVALKLAWDDTEMTFSRSDRNVLIKYGQPLDLTLEICSKRTMASSYFIFSREDTSPSSFGMKSMT
jgi:hypothetical protein